MNSNRDCGYTARCSPNPFLMPIHFCMSVRGRSVFSQYLVGAVFLSHECACDHLGYRTSMQGACTSTSSVSVMLVLLSEDHTLSSKSYSAVLIRLVFFISVILYTFRLMAGTLCSCLHFGQDGGKKR